MDTSHASVDFMLCNNKNIQNSEVKGKARTGKHLWSQVKILSECLFFFFCGSLLACLESPAKVKKN